MKSSLILLAAAVCVGACAVRTDGPPAIAIDRTACSFCGMLISEPLHAAAVQAPGADDQVYDDIGCLVAAAHGHRTPGARYWVHDATDRRWMDAATASFVVSPAVRTPMAGGVLAFASRAAAERAASAHGVDVVASLDLLLSRPGGRR